MKKARIQMRLFWSYSIIIIALLLAFTVIGYSWMSSSIKKTGAENLFQTANTVTKELDALLDNANALSVKILYSARLKTLFYSDMYATSEESLRRRREFHGEFYSILGPQIPSMQVNMFRPGSGEFVGIGLVPVITSFPTEDLQKNGWLEDCMQMGGAKLVVPTHENTHFKDPSPVVSLARTFGKSWEARHDSIIEIQVPYEQIAALANASHLTPDMQTRTYIFAQNGALVFPYDSDTPQELAQLLNSSNPLKPTLLEYNVDGRGQVAAFAVASPGWVVVITQDSSVLTSGLARMRNNMILLVALALCFALFLSNQLSRRITKPITQIRDTVAALSLNTLNQTDMMQVEPELNELEELRDTFKDMCSRLEQSLDETVRMRSMEMQSRMLALQSQMNPHFLHNTITTISILSENGENELVCGACEKLSDMLRYMSSGSNRLISVAEEMEQVEIYFDLIKLRFGEKSQLTSTLAPELLLVKIPRFTLQPLVENCTKYAFSSEPPWLIQVEGSVHQNTWTIQVSDNGNGFSAKTLQQLDDSIANAYELSSKLALDGMGLVNIYTRLSLLYGESTIFRYGNNARGGAYIEIGGLLNEEDLPGADCGG